MSHPRITTQTELIEAINSAWMELERFLSTLTDDETALRDDQGWSVADHVAHVAVWEDSVSILFDGKPRHEALGVDETYYLEASFDQLNERIRQLRGEISIEEATEQLRTAHHTLLGHLANLNKEDLETTVRDLFPAAPRTDERQVISLIYGNTANHLSEHLE